MSSSLVRKLSGVIYSSHKANSVALKASSIAFCTKSFSSTELEPEADSDSESARLPPDSSSSSNQQQNYDSRPLENGLDLGIYKAILVGQLGQAPIQKRLRSGRTVTLLSIGTGGIRNNRRPLDHEEPKDYANRCAVQWHRVSVYPERLGEVASKNLVPGAILYVEGNLETKVFNDPITGLVRRIREIAVRRNGRILFLGNGAESEKLSKGDISGVGYY